MQWLEHRIHPPIVTVLVGLGMYLLARAFPSPEIPLGPSGASAIGVGFALLGALLVPLAALHFRRAKTTPYPLQPERASAIVTTGLYRYTRNPMYLAMVLGLVGLAVYLRAVCAWAGPPLLFAFLTRFQIIPEERALLAKFGSPYASYKASVRRWL